MPHRPTIAHLGCGGRGREHLRAIADPASGVRMVGLCDQHAPSLAAGAALAPAGTPTFADAEALLTRTRPDVFSFVTLPATRLAMVDLAIRCGVRAIVLEKPLATTLADGRAIVARARDAGVLLIVSHQHKYGGHWRAVKALIDAGELGRVREINVSAKGWMLQYASHLIDYATWLNGGAAPVRMLGVASGRGRLGDSHPSPDHVLGRCAFANGVVGTIECGALAPDQDESLVPHFWMNAGATVIGTDGVAQVMVGRGWRAVTACRGALGSDDERFDGVADTVPLYADLARALADPAFAHPCRGEVALGGHEAMLAIAASAIERRPLPVPLPADLGYEPLARLADVLPADAPGATLAAGAG